MQAEIDREEASRVEVNSNSSESDEGEGTEVSSEYEEEEPVEPARVMGRRESAKKATQALHEQFVKKPPKHPRTPTKRKGKKKKK